jgi:hypothetical protein
MGQANPVMVAVGGDKDLGFVAKPAEYHRMDDPVAITLKDIAWPTRAVIRFRMGPAARFERLRG